MREKIIRDPVHDVIAFRLDLPDERLLFNLVNAIEFQRLRRIRQLGMAALAYPGADHSRYGHCLGVMQTARRMLDRLSLEIPIDPDDRTACLAAALLHDLGHGPFSHVFERVGGLHHEHLTQRVLMDPDSQVHRLLAEFDRLLPQRVLGLLAGGYAANVLNPPRSFLHDLIASQLDADRLDYLLRDNLMTGSGYGDYDLTWMLHALTVDPQSNRLAVTMKGISAVEAYLQSRFHMYRNVYFHKVVRAGEGMVKLALQRARRLAVQDRLPWPVRDHPVHKALTGMRLSTEEFVELDDVAVLHCFKIWLSSEDAVLARLCHGLLYRRLFKTVDLSTCEDSACVRRILDRCTEEIDAAGGDGHYDFFYDQPEDTPYEIYTGHGAGQEILLRDSRGQRVEFSTLSPLPAGLSRQLMFRRLHVLSEHRAIAERIAREEGALA